MRFFKGPKKVLVADDEQDTCLVLKRYLERKRFKVAVAFDGLEARKLIETEPFDCFLLDCSMPGATGLELIETARRRNPKAKIVLISGFPSMNDAAIQKLGGDQFLHKPIQLDEINNILQGSRTS